MRRRHGHRHVDDESHSLRFQLQPPRVFLFPLHFFACSNLSDPLAKKTYNIEVGHKARPYGKNETSSSCAYFARGPLNASDVAQTFPNKLQTPPTSLKLCQTNFQRFRRRSHFVTNKLPAPLTPLKASKQPWTSSEASKLS